MATVSIGRLTTDFIFSEDPIIATITPKSFQNNSAFRQVIVEVAVDVLLSDGSVSAQEHTFILNADENNTSVKVDISSSIRSALARWSYDADAVKSGATIEYPYAQFVVTAWEREYFDGTIVNQSTTSTEPYKAYLGGVGEYERWKNPTPSGLRLSSKPSSGEIHAGGQLVCDSFLLSESDLVKTLVSTASSSMDTDSRNRTVFLFVNSFGVFETISVQARESLGYEIVSSRKRLSQPPSYAAKPGVIAHKQGGGAVWQFSSGYVNAEWADWFATSFLMAKRYWMLHDNRWLPVAVEPDSDTVMVYDSNDPSLVAVNFSVRSAVMGSVR